MRANLEKMMYFCIIIRGG